MKKIILLTLALLGWATLAVRLYLRIVNSDFSPLESTIQFFSYFTILTNLLVTVYCSGQLLKSEKRYTSIFNKPETLMALTVFILIVGLVYHIALKPIWNPEGLQMLLSEIHHTIVPLGTLILWIISNHKNLVELKNLIKWLWYPIIYILFVLTRGSFSNFYPYPFLDVQSLGMGKVLINSLILLSVMVTFLLIFFYIGKKVKNETVANSG